MRNAVRTFACTATTAPLPSVMLREAARRVDAGLHRTICGALSRMVPADEHGNAAWWEAHDWTTYILPDHFETDWGWWADREPRVIGALLAAAIAESEGY